MRSVFFVANAEAGRWFTTQNKYSACTAGCLRKTSVELYRRNTLCQLNAQERTHRQTRGWAISLQIKVIHTYQVKWGRNSPVWFVYLISESHRINHRQLQSHVALLQLWMKPRITHYQSSSSSQWQITRFQCIKRQWDIIELWSIINHKQKEGK